MLLAHDRELYLRPGLRLWAAVKGIEQAVLVASHHGTHDGVWRLVEGVRFCAVQQLIFPHAGRYRGAHVLKLHFTWAVDQAFRMWSAREVAYMEDDYWVTPDFFRSALRLRDARARHCAECVGTVVGDHPRDWTAEDANAAAWASAARGAPAPALRGLRAATARRDEPAARDVGRRPRLHRHVLRPFDRGVRRRDPRCRTSCGGRAWSRAAAASRPAGSPTPSRARSTSAAAAGFRSSSSAASVTPPRAAACNVTHDLRQFVRTWVAPWRAGGPFAGEALGANGRWEPKEPRQKWRPRGAADVRDRYAWNGAGAPVGVAISRRRPRASARASARAARGARPVR